MKVLWRCTSEKYEEASSTVKITPASGAMKAAETPAPVPEAVKSLKSSVLLMCPHLSGNLRERNWGQHTGVRSAMLTPLAFDTP